MYEKIKENQQVIDLCLNAMQKVGIKPIVRPIRGGSDGTAYTQKGLPCPNFFAGGENFHSRFEYLPVNSLIKCTELIVKMCELVVGNN